MQKREGIIFLGIDLVQPYNEMIVKLVYSILPSLKRFRIISVNKHKKPIKTKHISNVSSKIKALSGIKVIFLIFYFIKIKKFKKVNIFWSGFGWYDNLITNITQFLGGDVIYTIVNLKQSRYPCLNSVNKIIALSPQRNIKLDRFKHSKVVLPGVDLKKFYSNKEKTKDVLFINTAQSIEAMNKRGTNLFYKFCEFAKSEDSSLKFFMVNRWIKGKNILDKMKKDKDLSNLEILHQNVKNLEEIYADYKIILNFNTTDDVPLISLSKVEALASGCYVVSISKNWLNDFIEANNVGKTVDPNVESIFKEITKTLNEYDFKSNNHQKLVFDNFDLEKFISNYQSAL